MSSKSILEILCSLKGFSRVAKDQKDEFEIASSGVTIQQLKELQMPTPQELENLHRLESTDS